MKLRPVFVKKLTRKPTSSLAQPSTKASGVIRVSVDATGIDKRQEMRRLRRWNFAQPASRLPPRPSRWLRMARCVRLLPNSRGQADPVAQAHPGRRSRNAGCPAAPAASAEPESVRRAAFSRLPRRKRERAPVARAPMQPAAQAMHAPQPQQVSAAADARTAGS